MKLPVQSSAARRWRDAGAWALVALVLLAPLPAGSNRGAVWAFWAMLLGAMAVAHLVAQVFSSSRRPVAWSEWRWLWPLPLTMGYALMQSLPLAGALPVWLLQLPATGAPAPATISLAPAASQLALLRWGAMVLFFVLMRSFCGGQQRRRALGWALFAGVALHALWALAQLRLFGDSHLWGPKLAYAGSATGPFINRSAFAAFMGLGAVLGLALLRERQAPRAIGAAGALLRGLLWLALALVLLAQLVAQSRLALGATLLALALVWQLTARHRMGQAHWVMTAAAIALAMLAFATQGQALLTRGLWIAPDLASRSALYGQLFGMIATRPLTGFGLDGFALAYEQFHRPPVSAAVIWDMAHSTVLAIWVELGLVAGSLLLFMAVAVTRRLIGSLRQGAPLATAALAALLLAALHATLDFSFEVAANQFLLLAIVALGLAPREAAR
jgi:O-antigen ligase